MFKFIKNLLGLAPKQETVQPQVPYKVEPPNEVVITRIIAPASNPDVVVTPAKAERAKDAKGRFKADDPSTPDVNEAWKGGKAPTKKVRAISVPVDTKTKAKPAITEGNTKGGNNVVKLKPKSGKKPNKPKSPRK